MATQDLLVTLVDTRTERRLPSQFTRTLRTIAFVVVWIVTIYATAILTMWLAWDTLAWWVFWVITLGILLLFPFSVFYWKRLNEPRSSVISRSLVREIMTLPDDHLLPPVLFQPVAANQIGIEQQLGPFMNSSSQAGNLIAISGASVVISMIIFLIVAMSFIVLPSVTSLRNTLVVTLAIPATIAVLSMITLLTVAISALVRLFSQRLLITTNSNGITWRYG